ncbi:MAG: DUF1080 domain-containing protein [Thermoguttaceae bacterium]|nr:DUF1080 domain-containing protein [Thermoguttaceae bacterium]MDW8038027.1 DUF1080 domain-containing protein [Thermoguttaceae bacterium]
MNTVFGNRALFEANQVRQAGGFSLLGAVWTLVGWVALEGCILQAGECQKSLPSGVSSVSLAEKQPAGPASAQPAQSSPSGSQEAAQSKEPSQSKPKADDPYAWKELFDGKTLKGWKTPEFGGEGKVEVKDGQIILHAGQTMTGIVYEGKVPTTNYELELEGKRISGSDFFATTTFPVGDSHVSFVTGGWGGTVIGISCVDWRDASDNPTSAFREFKNNQWYKFRIRVTDARIQVWIDGDLVVDLPRKGYKFSTRAECDPCRPLGIASWCTTGAVRNIRIRQLKPEEVKQTAEEK